jgi:hypothetical protein
MQWHFPDIPSRSESRLIRPEQKSPPTPLRITALALCKIGASNLFLRARSLNFEVCSFLHSAGGESFS